MLDTSFCQQSDIPNVHERYVSQNLIYIIFRINKV